MNTLNLHCDGFDVRICITFNQRKHLFKIFMFHCSFFFNYDHLKQFSLSRIICVKHWARKLTLSVCCVCRVVCAVIWWRRMRKRRRNIRINWRSWSLRWWRWWRDTRRRWGCWNNASLFWRRRRLDRTPMRHRSDTQQLRIITHLDYKPKETRQTCGEHSRWDICDNQSHQCITALWHQTTISAHTRTRWTSVVSRESCDSCQSSFGMKNPVSPIMKMTFST